MGANVIRKWKASMGLGAGLMVHSNHGSWALLNVRPIP